MIWAAVATTTFLLGTVLSVCSSAAAAPGPGSQTISGESWLSYMITPRVGRTCTLESITSNAMGSGVATEALRVSRVGQRADGIHLTIVHTLNSQFTQADGTVTYGTPYSFSLPFAIESDGTLRVAPDIGTETDGARYRFDNSILYPTVTTLRHGGHATSIITASMTSSDPSMQSELEGMIKPGQTALRMRLTFRVTGRETSAPIVTPAGSFTDVVGVDVSQAHVEALNLRPGAQTGLLLALNSLNTTTTFWFARGIGEIETDMSGFSQKLAGCAG
jgi:hypothetical protein